MPTDIGSCVRIIAETKYRSIRFAFLFNTSHFLPRILAIDYPHGLQFRFEETILKRNSSDLGEVGIEN